MTLLWVSVAFVLIISALCSLSEASLYAIRITQVRDLEQQGSSAGETLARFKKNMEKPITAILIVNTVSNTAGAAVAGAQAQEVFHDKRLVLIFSIGFTLAVLILAEILPKVIGVVYNQPIARYVALPWAFMIRVMFPLVWLAQRASQWIKPSDRVFSAPEDEIEFLAAIGAEEGSIYPLEARLVKNVLNLNEVRANEIMTPRAVVFKLPAQMKLREVAKNVKQWTHSRIPLYDEKDPEKWVGVVRTREILSRLANDEFDLTLREISQPMKFRSEKTPGHVLLQIFLRQRSHILGVEDEYGSIVGVVTLEDVLESLIGQEIVDEADLEKDMQELARERHRDNLRRDRDNNESSPERPLDEMEQDPPENPSNEPAA